MEKVLNSGARLVVTPADFKDADGLRKAVIRSLKGVPLSPNILDTQMSSVKDAIFEIASSEEVEQLIFRCAIKATYDGARVEPALFDDPKVGAQARKDFHEMLAAIAWENVGPFFEQALSGLKPIIEKLSGNLASSSTQTKG